MLKKMIGVLILCIILFTFSNCVSTSRFEKDFSYQLEQCGINKTEHAIKSPGCAGALNILPGVGNFYLAAGSGEGSMWAIGFLNLLTWPLSIIWAVPEAAIDAEAINERETIRYYQFNGNGKKKLEECKKGDLSK